MHELHTMLKGFRNERRKGSVFQNNTQELFCHILFLLLLGFSLSKDPTKRRKGCKVTNNKTTVTPGLIFSEKCNYLCMD
jgi:hypothetical protein